MKKTILSTLTILLSLTASAQSAIDADFETGTLPTGWTTVYPKGYNISPEAGLTFGWQTADYSSKTQYSSYVGTNSLGGAKVLKSFTGKYGSSTNLTNDNWLISPEVTIDKEHCFLTFQFGANDAINVNSKTKSDENRMKMQILVSTEGTETSAFKDVKMQIIPMGVQKWCAYCIDLTSYIGKAVHIAFRDYGSSVAGSVRDSKFIDNIKLVSTAASDFAIEEVEAIHGQALYSQPFTISVTNYGAAAEGFTANYSYGDVTVSEPVTTDLASGESMQYTFKKCPSFTPGKNVTFKTWVSTGNDCFADNDTLADNELSIFSVENLPYSVCNKIATYKDIYGADSTAIEDDVIANEFEKFRTLVTSKEVYWWPYDNTKYHAWVFEQADSTEKYRGISYLYTTKALRLPMGKVTLTTTGTGTGPDMHYEVYIAKYWDKDLTASPILVGTSDIIPDARSTEEPFSTTKAELTIPEAGEYTLAIRPLTKYMAQMTVIGYSVTATELVGDVNGDNIVDISDASAVIAVIDGSTENKDKADVNGDGIVNKLDVDAVISNIWYSSTKK